VARADRPHLAPSSGPDLLLVTGPEPDLGWRALADDLKELTDLLGVRRYVGLGSVPGPSPPHPARPARLHLERPVAARAARAPHEQMVVPASAQVALEAELGAHGLTTLGMWVRIPHYVAGPYPEASRALLERLSSHLGTAVDLTDLDREIDENRSASTSQRPPPTRSASMSRSSSGSTTRRRSGSAGPLGIDLQRGAPITDVDVPTGDELAAEIERFLRGGLSDPARR
jgi:hypothetical protein